MGLPWGYDLTCCPAPSRLQKLMSGKLCSYNYPAPLHAPTSRLHSFQHEAYQHNVRFRRSRPLLPNRVSVIICFLRLLMLIRSKDISRNCCSSCRESRQHERFTNRGNVQDPCASSGPKVPRPHIHRRIMWSRPKGWVGCGCDLVFPQLTLCLLTPGGESRMPT
jgi:hypothetical protein